jgi:hypothetical protein
VNFDFVPGERVLFADDFSKDNVGDFPKRLESSTPVSRRAGPI